MKTYLDCIPCFFNQALEAARIAGAGPKTQRRILNGVAKALLRFPLTLSPPEMGRIIYGLVRKTVHIEDPYRKVKQQSNRMALRLYDQLKDRVKHSRDSLLTAIELSIAGNVIDYGVKNTLNPDTELKKILNGKKRTLRNQDGSFFDYPRFQTGLKKARSVLYLADNAGETVFDRILIEEIKKLDSSKKIMYAVKGTPVINDALAEDALASGLDQVARIISSGSDAPGTVLSRCSKDFLSIYKLADMVISKGQGNFEALSSTKHPVFFLLMAKCPVIAGDVGCHVGDIVLLYHSGKDGNR